MTKLLTGNRLETGDVLWWTGTDWSCHLTDAAAVDDAEALVARHIAEERINEPTLIDADPLPGGGWRPRTTRERVRAIGPSVRPDFALPSLAVSEI